MRTCATVRVCVCLRDSICRFHFRELPSAQRSPHIVKKFQPTIDVLNFSFMLAFLLYYVLNVSAVGSRGAEKRSNKFEHKSIGS